MLCDRNADDIHGSDYYSVVFRLHFRRQSRIATLLLPSRRPPREHNGHQRGNSGCQIQYNVAREGEEEEEEGMDILGGRLFLHDFSPSLPRMLDRITN